MQQSRAQETPTATQPGGHTLPVPVTMRGAGPPPSYTTEVSRDPPVIRLARHLLAILTALCTFGAGLAFEALQSAGSGAQAFLGWAFAVFAVGIVTTLIWQAALVADFHTFSGRMYRSHSGILGALSVGTLSAIGGTLLLSLSLTRHEKSSVRAAGYTVLSLVGLLVGGSTLRLIYTAIRRRAAYIRAGSLKSIFSFGMTLDIVIASPQTSGVHVIPLKSSATNQAGNSGPA